MILTKNDQVADYILILKYDTDDFFGVEKTYKIKKEYLNNILIELSIIRKFYELGFTELTITDILDDWDEDDLIEEFGNDCYESLKELEEYSVWYYTDCLENQRKADFVSWELLDNNLNSIDYVLSDGDNDTVDNTIFVIKELSEYL